MIHGVRARWILVIFLSSDRSLYQGTVPGGGGYFGGTLCTSL